MSAKEIITMIYLSFSFTTLILSFICVYIDRNKRSIFNLYMGEKIALAIIHSFLPVFQFLNFYIAVETIYVRIHERDN